MAEWGRKEYSKAWPSRRRVWTWTAFLATGIFFFGVFCLDYSQGWTAAERLYLMDYLKSGARGQAGASMQSKYTMLEGVTGQYNDRGMHALLGRWVFKHDDIWGCAQALAVGGRVDYRQHRQRPGDGEAEPIKGPFHAPGQCSSRARSRSYLVL